MWSRTLCGVIWIGLWQKVYVQAEAPALSRHSPAPISRGSSGPTSRILPKQMRGVRENEILPRQRAMVNRETEVSVMLPHTPLAVRTPFPDTLDPRCTTRSTHAPNESLPARPVT